MTGIIKKKKKRIPLYFHFLLLYNATRHQYPYSQEDQHYKHKDALSLPCISYPEIWRKKKKSCFQEHLSYQSKNDHLRIAFCLRFSKETQYFQSAFTFSQNSLTAFKISNSANTNFSSSNDFTGLQQDILVFPLLRLF